MQLDLDEISNHGDRLVKDHQFSFLVPKKNQMKHLDTFVKHLEKCCNFTHLFYMMRQRFYKHPHRCENKVQ